ncbi:phenylalanine ammonia-lyase-like protein [Aaosphaeria arxii CBS 175.79]|uniref:Phenylalanine ammonia-lyase-like protein n=1 Tax=Aaosphaeria arxii CBS 175.79 TaxID=1450172 RepID=A0A6A5XXQ3_9PLEO|nr:phenylalanine ammonia-lyase-like protein [Aaosphaeria arxii CBS 175.79]KAF2018088.1 phenylalanine ammonia-lyase-like protein [Aaosphaeria arxii CBS 175.79]
MAPAGQFIPLLVDHWQSLRNLIIDKTKTTTIDGKALKLADVIASARYGRKAIITNQVLEHVGKDTEQVYGKLKDGEVLYGINTGFGGSANVRSQAVEEIQRGLIRGLHYGVLSGNADFDIESELPPGFTSSKPLSSPIETTSMPESWVRGSMLIRLNSLSRGASGVRPVFLERLLQLLNQDIVPRVPLRGSISASGDLSPLSYLGGVLQGKPSVQAWIDRDNRRELVSAQEALAFGQIQPIDIRAKEGLALVNGTAASAAVASLAVHEVLCLASVSQVLTAMSVETLCGTEESFDAFFAQVRPHPGQIECANSLRSFLRGSSLVADNNGSQEFSLRQERYSTRTAPQWIGPVLEDLVLAHSQVSIEINSVTDNPLINPSGKLLHGGNFQAKAVTSAMEKARQGCQALGQIMFAQCTEIINPSTNKGLAPNLVVDEPSQSWIWKGTDIYVAALQSELGFLANPVSHVQSAEMGNQSINSLALISGRYTLTAVDTLTQLAAANLVALCQALDLRALDLQFRNTLEPKFKEITRRCIDSCVQTPSSGPEFEQLINELWAKFADDTYQTTHMDSSVRFLNATDNLQARFLRKLPSTQTSLQAVQDWGITAARTSSEIYATIRAQYLANPDAKPILGVAARRLYEFVRTTLGVPFFGEEYIREADFANGIEVESPDPKFKFRTMGSMISAVYEAMRNGSLYDVVVQCFEEVDQYTV